MASEKITNNIAIIPARGGSKRIHGKNIMDFFGKPMIGHTLEAATESKVFSKVVVSTENQKIRDIALDYGCDVIARPGELSVDTANLIDVILHVIDHLESQHIFYKNGCVLLANCPIRDHIDTRNSWNAFKNSSSDFMAAVFNYGMFYPFWAMEKTDEGLKPFWKELFDGLSQDLPKAYCPSGALRWFDIEAFKKSKDFYGPGVAGFLLPWYKAMDIDTHEDLLMAGMIASSMIEHPEYFEGFTACAETV